MAHVALVLLLEISHMMLFLLFFVAIDEPVDYGTAYKSSQKSGKPLVVFVTAKWCTSCKTLLTTVKTLNTEGVVIGLLDIDDKRFQGTYQKLPVKRGVPAIVGYKKNAGKWRLSRPKSHSKRDLQQWFNELKIKNVPAPIHRKGCN